MLSSQEWILIAVIAVTMVILVTDKIRPDLLAILLMALLPLTGIVTYQESLSGFSRSVVITIICLFIITETLERTGTVQWIADRLREIGAGSEPRLIILFMGTGAALSLLMNNVAASWREFIEYSPGSLETTFESVSTDQMVVISGMKVWSMCEHHLMPFWCDISVGYIARDRVLGLSKFGRIAHKFAHRLQLQEQLTHQIADEIQAVTNSPDVAVFGRGEHLCMSMRGIRTPAIMTSSVVRGMFKESAEARSEFLSLATAH